LINKSEEIELIKKVQAGDTSAFKPLIEEYKDVSLSLANSFLNDFDQAEDVTQESFIRAYRSIKKFKFDSAFSTWLFRIVVNQAKSNTSRLNRFKQRFSPISDNSDNFSSEPPLEFGNNNKEMINHVLDKLKPDFSLILRLYYLAEKDLQEIKTITNFSESKVKTTLFRARKAFKSSMEKYLGKEIEDLR
jgi:RNA polymerase sigma-70 factor (ECF subfamily)